MSTYLLKRIQQQLTTVHFMQRILGPTVIRKLFKALFENLALSLRFLQSICQSLCEKPWSRVNPSSLGLRKPKIDREEESTVDAGGQGQALVSQSTIYEQIIISPDNIACSLDPSDGIRDDLGSQSSQMLPLGPPVLLSPVMLSGDRNTPIRLHISGPDDHFPKYLPSSEQLYLVSSPTADIIHRPEKVHHRMRGYNQDSTESIELLPRGGISNSCNSDMTVVTAGPSTCSPVGLPEILSPQETLISTSVEGLKIPALFSEHSDARLYPVAPENFKRYEMKRKIPKTATKVKMSPFSRDFSDHDDIPGWTTYIHPEGSRYFHHAEKRIYTDVDLHDSAYLRRITDLISIINLFIIKHHIRIPEKTDLVLDIVFDKKIRKYDNIYYFADHESRIVFFLDEFLTDNLPHWFEIEGVNSGPHLRQAIEIQYWWHCNTYPNCIDLSSDLVRELRSLVLFSIGDCMTSPYANSPYTLENLQKILSNTNSVEDNVVDGGKPDSGCIVFLSRLMYEFHIKMFLNFHGQPQARLNRQQSVYGNRTNRRTWFIRTISIFLFSAPDVHLETLQKMWVDGILHHAIWEESLKKVSDEWREFTLNATVMLSANMAFLSIQSVDTNRNPYRSPAQISSYCSISCSVGSIILGLLLVRQNQTKHRDTAHDVQKFLKKRAHPWFGLETLAIMFSLPYALLMWSTSSFLTAFWFMCLQDSGSATRSVVVTVCFIILILIVWCIWMSWEKPPESDAIKDDDPTFKVDHAKQKSRGLTFDTAILQKPAENQRRSTILSWSPPFPLNIRSDTSKTVVEESENGKGKGKPSL